MAELSKLLAFMFKEDKEDILAQYNKMLDESDDEQALLESFGSPTKLAVTISRTYKRSERKLAVEADSKEDKPAETEHIFVTPVKKEKTADVPQKGASAALCRYSATPALKRIATRPSRARMVMRGATVTA